MIYTILIIVQVVVSVTLVGLILVQHGKGADAGAAFGSGASGTVFGAKGSANFLSHATAGLATVFFVISLTLAYLINGVSAPTGSVTDQMPSGSGSSVLSDKNGNGVAGDEVITGKTAPKVNPPSDGAPSQGKADDNGTASQPADDQGRQNSKSGSGDDTGAKIPE